MHIIIIQILIIIKVIKSLVKIIIIQPLMWITDKLNQIQIIITKITTIKVTFYKFIIGHLKELYKCKEWSN
jgi:hypothetical protein